MKKLVLLGFALTCLVQAQAQFKVGVQTGVTLANLQSNMYYHEIKTGWLVGVVGEYTFKQGIVVQSSVQLSAKGSTNMRDEEHGGKVDLMDIRLTYLEVPLTIGYKIPVADHVKLVPNCGVYFAHGLLGSSKVFGRNTKDEAYSNGFQAFDGFDKTRTGDDARQMKGFNRFDWGTRFGITAEVYKFSLGVSYDLGLQIIRDNFEFGGGKVMNRSTAIVLGYMF